MSIFGKKLTPQEQVRKWRLEMKKEERILERQIRSIEAEEKKVIKEIKKAAKEGDKTSAKILAKELIRSKKAVQRLHTGKAQMNSVVMSMQQNLATAKLAGVLQNSTEVMRGMNSLIRLPEISATMQAMSQEMMKAGIIQDMIDDTMEMNEESDLDDEADEEVDKVLQQITASTLGEATTVTTELPSKKKVAAPAAAAAAEEEEEPADEQEIVEMQARLAALNG